MRLPMRQFCVCPSLQLPLSTLAKPRLKAHSERKTYLHSEYCNLLQSSEAVILAQHNNVSSKELVNLRTKLGKQNATLKILNTGMFRRVLKDSAPELAVLVTGPTCAITFKEFIPQHLKAALKIVRNSDGSLLVLGGGLEKGAQRRIMDFTCIEWAGTLKNLEETRAELVGILSWVGGGELKRILDRIPQSLLLTMQAREKDLQE